MLGSYYLYFYISPSVTVKNESHNIITNVNVSLPESNLDFGSIEVGEGNTIYYSLSQSDGSFNYSFMIGNKQISGFCGYMTNNEVNKRFVIAVSKSNVVVCSE
jgi:hypothetical protein